MCPGAPHNTEGTLRAKDDKVLDPTTQKRSNVLNVLHVEAHLGCGGTHGCGYHVCMSMVMTIIVQHDQHWRCVCLGSQHSRLNDDCGDGDDNNCNIQATVDR